MTPHSEGAGPPREGGQARKGGGGPHGKPDGTLFDPGPPVKRLKSSPLKDALDEIRRIEEIVKDLTLTPSERIALLGLVVHVDRKTWLAYPGFRCLHRETGAHPREINTAIKKSLGRHIVKAGQAPGRAGLQGGVQYGILRGGTPTDSASVGEALEGASASISASIGPPKRFLGGSETGCTENHPPLGEGNQGPAPESCDAPTTAATAAAPGTGPGASADLDQDPAQRAFVAMGERFPLEEVRGHVERDLTAGTYSAVDLAAYLDDGGTPAYPSDLKRLVPAFLAARRKAAFADELRRIHNGKLMRATHVTAGPARRARVFSIDVDAGLLILEERVDCGRPGESAEALRQKIAEAQADASGEAGFKRDTAAITERRLRDRLVVVESGKPDPAAVPPRFEHLEIRTLKALNEWRFELLPAPPRKPSRPQPAEAVSHA